MSKQTMASAYWAHQQDRAKLEHLREQATNYSYPAGQAQAGLQYALVEVPHLLEEIEYLRSQLNEQHRATA